MTDDSFVHERSLGADALRLGEMRPVSETESQRMGQRLGDLRLCVAFVQEPEEVAIFSTSAAPAHRAALFSES
jgi:hypothetical protein